MPMGKTLMGPAPLPCDPWTRTVIRYCTVAMLMCLGLAACAPMTAEEQALNQPASLPVMDQGLDESPAYNRYCIVCHGPDKAGVQGLGISLQESSLVSGSSVEEIVAFLRRGRMPDDPASMSGQPMPGFDYLPEADLNQIAIYLKQVETP